MAFFGQFFFKIAQAKSIVKQQFLQFLTQSSAWFIWYPYIYRKLQQNFTFSKGAHFLKVDATSKFWPEIFTMGSYDPLQWVNLVSQLIFQKSAFLDSPLQGALLSWGYLYPSLMSPKSHKTRKHCQMYPPPLSPLDASLPYHACSLGLKNFMSFVP